MNVLDENLADEHQTKLLQWRIRTRKIGKDVGRSGMSDEDVIPLLHRLGSVTFFTGDEDYFKPSLRHASYCLVWLEKFPYAEVPDIIRKFLRRPSFRTWALRKGKVVRAHIDGMTVWSLNTRRSEQVAW